jgi:hypothetical protein
MFDEEKPMAHSMNMHQNERFKSLICLHHHHQELGWNK